MEEPEDWVEEEFDDEPPAETVQASVAELAAEIAVQTVQDFQRQPTSIQKVIFNVFKEQDRQYYERLLSAAGTAAGGAARG